MSQKIVIANWKMHKTRKEAVLYLSHLKPSPKIDLRIAASYTLIQDMALHPIHEKIQMGAQNMSSHTEGAFTGEVSIAQLRDIGADFVVLGHSERRHIFKETDEEIRAKIERAVVEGMPCIVCVGETLEDRNSGNEKKVIQKQLFIALNGFDEKHFSKIMIAYEPVWAIGTGNAATKEQAEEIHSFIKEVVPFDVKVLYGGSVNVDNIAAFLSQPSIDGALVGGAMLDVENANQLIENLED